MARPCFSGGLVPYATLINFSQEPTTASSTGSAKKFYDDQMAFWDPIIKDSGANPE